MPAPAAAVTGCDPAVEFTRYHCAPSRYDRCAARAAAASTSAGSVLVVGRVDADPFGGQRVVEQTGQCPGQVGVHQPVWSAATPAAVPRRSGARNGVVGINSSAGTTWLIQTQRQRGVGGMRSPVKTYSWRASHP